MRIFILILAWIMAFPPALMAEVFFYHTDNVGTPVAMTDRTGAVVWRANDLPFGEQHTTQGTGQNNRRLAGKEMDETTGLVSMGASDTYGKLICPCPMAEHLPVADSIFRSYQSIH
jgi:hypothetical protein